MDLPEPSAPQRETLLQFWVGVLIRVIELALAIPVSMLPAAWRDRLSWSHGLPLAGGTFASAVIQGCLGAGLFIYIVYIHRSGHTLWAPIAAYPGWFTLASAYNILEAGARMLHALVVSEPLGTLPLWLIERAGPWRRAIRRRVHERYGQPAPLPPARLLRKQCSRE